jgi:hypothetical protein
MAYRSLNNIAKQLLPSFLWGGLRSTKNSLRLRFRTVFENLGYTIALTDNYYSPLPSVSHLKSTFKRWNRPSELVAIEYNLQDMMADFANLLACYLDEFLQIPPYTTLEKMGFGPGYAEIDALTLYMMIRHIKPRRYIEVGAGLSTYYCSLAAERNGKDGYPLQIICIEPHPFRKLNTIPGIDLIVKEVQTVERSFFQQLAASDVLFIDSSHILRIDGDVPFLYLEVLPSLNPGVLIQIHDVPFPYNIPYPPDLWIFGQDWPMFWNEAMVLQAFLCFNKAFKIVVSTPLIRHFDETFLHERIPFYKSVDENPNTFSSIWLRRIDPNILGAWDAHL